MNANQVTGKITISTASLGVLRSKAGATLDFGGVKRAEVIDDQGVAGFTSEPAAPSIDATLTHKSGISLKAVAAIESEDVSFETDTGGHWVLRNAWCVDTVTLSGGEVKAKFVGISCDEVKA